jgi:hypothetical protein
MANCTKKESNSKEVKPYEDPAYRKEYWKKYCEEDPSCLECKLFDL